jgi:hypothetical protein
MRVYDKQDPFYAGIDLHSRTMHLCTSVGAEVQKARPALGHALRSVSRC